MKYARVLNRLVVEIFTPPSNFGIDECFHPDVRALFEEVSDEVDVGFIKHQDGTFTAPVQPTIPVTVAGEQT